MERVASARVLVVGAGGLGCPASLALAQAGTGPAGLTAAAYVAAGGTAVAAGAEPLSPGAEGFLVSAGEVGQPASEVLGRVLPELEVRRCGRCG